MFVRTKQTKQSQVQKHFVRMARTKNHYNRSIFKVDVFRKEPSLCTQCSKLQPFCNRRGDYTNNTVMLHLHHCMTYHIAFYSQLHKVMYITF